MKKNIKITFSDNSFILEREDGKKDVFGAYDLDFENKNGGVCAVVLDEVAEWYGRNLLAALIATER